MNALALIEDVAEALYPSEEQQASNLIQFDYAPQGAVLEQYILSTVQRTMVMGPLGSGKTNASCWKGFRIMCAQEPDADGVRRTRGVGIRNTYGDLFATTIKDWLECFGDLGSFTKGGKEPPTHTIRFRLDDGTRVEAEMIFLALDREEHVKKLRGLQATFAWLNEVKELVFAVVEMLDLRVGRYPQSVAPTWYGIFGDTNAPDTDHWYYRLAEEMKPQNWAFLRQPGGVVRRGPEFPWEENHGQYAPALPGPAENLKNLPVRYYPGGCEGKLESWILVNLANQYGYVSDGRPIYTDYNDAQHCREFDLVPGLPLHIGLDFGLTPAAVIGQRMTNGQVRWRHELCTTDTGIVRFGNILRTFLSDHCAGYAIGSITGDPAGDQRQAGDNEERTVFQILAEECGIEAQPAPGNNDFTLRTEAVSTSMRTLIDGAPGFLIHPDMRVTRKGCQGAYKFRRLKVSGDERYEDKPLKNANSHPCEAMQYGHLGLGIGDTLLRGDSPARAEDAEAFRKARGMPAQDVAAASRMARRQAEEDASVRAFRSRRGLR